MNCPFFDFYFCHLPGQLHLSPFFTYYTSGTAPLRSGLLYMCSTFLTSQLIL